MFKRYTATFIRTFGFVTNFNLDVCCDYREIMMLAISMNVNLVRINVTCLLVKQSGLFPLRG